MRARPVAVIAALGSALGLGACGTESAGISPACLAGTQAVQRALTAAPGAVALEDGTRLSQCTGGEIDDGDVQLLGAILTDTGERLEARAATDPRAALQLGYLVGAARRGARESNGALAEVVRRLERSAALDGGSSEAVAAVARGLQAGEASG